VHLYTTRDEAATYGIGGSVECLGTADASHMTVSAVPGWPPIKGVSGVHFQLYGGPLSWRAGTQQLTSHSSTDSELYALGA
jgi:hypothetical protein